MQCNKSKRDILKYFSLFEDISTVCEMDMWLIEIPRSPTCVTTRSC